MFVSKGRGGYTRDGEQYCIGRFLVLFGSSKEGLWGVVRRCSLRQCGHFMMGHVKLGDQTITVSGTYGGDGLPMDLDSVHEWNRPALTRMPPDIEEQFWKGGGWNDAGSEGPAVRLWGQSIDGKGGKVGPLRWRGDKSPAACDSQEVYLPECTSGGGSMYRAIPGCLVTYTYSDGAEKYQGMVLGRVAEGEHRGHLVVLELNLTLCCMYQRWVDPQRVTYCCPLPTHLFSFLAGLTPEKVRRSGEALLGMEAYGSLCDRYIDGALERLGKEW